MEFLVLFLALSIGVSVTITGMWITAHLVKIKSDLVELLVFSLLSLYWLLAGGFICGFVLNLFGVK